jgi:hypothetical protein
MTGDGAIEDHLCCHRCHPRAAIGRSLRSRFDWLREPDPDAVGTPPLLMAFDVLHRDGRDLSAQPLRSHPGRDLLIRRRSKLLTKPMGVSTKPPR